MPATDTNRTQNPTTIEGLTALFSDFLLAGRYLANWSPRTGRSYEQAFAALKRTLSDDDELNRATLDRFVIDMRQRGLSPGGCNAYIRAVNSFLSWLNRERNFPALKLRQLSNPLPPVKGFSDAEIRALTGFRPRTATQKQTWTLTLTLLDCGARIDELLTLKAVDVDFDNLLLTLHGKGSKIRRVPFSLEGRKLLFRHARRPKTTAQERSEFFFCTSSGLPLRYRNVYRDIKTLCAVAGVVGPHVHPHAFRHAFAVNFIRQGGDIYRLARLLGHASINTTQLYIRSMTVEQVAEAHRSPLSRVG
jgi:integrase/recombinase XerD